MPIDMTKIREYVANGIAKFNSKNIEAAINSFKAAEVLDPANPVVLYNLGVAYTKQGLYRTAAEYFSKLVKQPASADILTVKKLLAYCWIMMNNFSGAVSVLKGLLSISRNDISALNMLAYAYEKSGETESAVVNLKKVLEIDSENVNALNSLAYIYADTGKEISTALIFAKKIVDKFPENPAYNDTLGFVYYKMGQEAMAKKFLKKAFMIMPQSEDIKQHLSKLLNI